MVALTTHRATKDRANGLPVPRNLNLPVAAATTIYAGAMVAENDAGYLVPASSSAALKVIGKADETIDNSAGLAGDKRCRVHTGVFNWNNSASTDAITIAHKYEPCYAVDDNTVALTNGDGSRPFAGIVYDVDSVLGVDVRSGPEMDLIGRIQKRSLTVGHADLTASAATQTIAIGAPLPANARILGANVKLPTNFSGGSVSALLVDIGSTGDTDAIVDGAVLQTAAVDGQATSVPAGIAPHKHFSTSTQLNALFTATGGNVVDLTAGECTIEVLFIVMR